MNDEYKQYDLGDLVRRVRKERSLNLLDLVDSKLSKSTISRLENGQAVDDDKMQLILGKLGIRDTDIPKILEDFKIQDEIEQHMFRSIESQIRQGILSLAEFNEKLKYISLPVLESYLRAKRYFIKKNYKKAVKHYELTITSNDNECCPYSNVKATSYLDLSVIAYKESDFQKALLYIDQGLEEFNEQGLKKHVKYSLIYNNAFILEQLGLIREAEEILEPAWQHRDLIGDIRTQIQVYQLKSAFYRYNKNYIKAYDILSQAFDIANINALADQSYYVLVDIGKITYELGRLEYSKRCLLSALKFKKKLENATSITAHIELSKTYLALGDIKKAKEEITEAIQISKKTKVKDINKRIQAYIVLAGIFRTQKNEDEACNHYQKALNLANKYRFDQYKPELYDHLSKCNN
jgi:tetratricopeptide (TPR) repeat protein